VLPGHLIFVVKEIPHSSFRRETNNLHTVLVISLKEALLGFEKEITHLDDRNITIKREIVSQPGDIIKIEGEGMPIHQSSEKGDLYVRVDIQFPKILTEKQIESNFLILINQYLVAKLLFEKRSNW
jgi:DnaJ-class molecular chaperone